ncbi:hypothetical protein D9758_013344 [Tetrapyrgos nigripes]|uniref:Uncharacterized protein n=1 Tax=Tetrapyrgos nigripes TaxID=182062 RepID=A0A8H5CJE6_9AGAR|nr:hypothetical protein D9758_013344 [Tetrapyrgos nigripes]
MLSAFCGLLGPFLDETGEQWSPAQAARTAVSSSPEKCIYALSAMGLDWTARNLGCHRGVGGCRKGLPHVYWSRAFLLGSRFGLGQAYDIRTVTFPLPMGSYYVGIVFVPDGGPEGDFGSPCSVHVAFFDFPLEYCLMQRSSCEKFKS